MGRQRGTEAEGQLPLVGHAILDNLEVDAADRGAEEVECQHLGIDLLATLAHECAVVHVHRQDDRHNQRYSIMPSHVFVSRSSQMCNGCPTAATVARG